MAGQALRQIVGHLVARRRPLRDGHAEPAVHRTRHERPLRQSDQRSLPENIEHLLVRFVEYDRKPAQGKPQDASIDRVDPSNARLHRQVQREVATRGSRRVWRGEQVTHRHNQGAEELVTTGERAPRKPV